MAKRIVPKAETIDLAKLRRHIVILADIGRLSATADSDTFLDHVVVQVARAVEIDHVKILLYRKTTSDFIVAAGYGWHEGVVRAATMAADLRSPAGRAYHTGEPVTAIDLLHSEFECPAILRAHDIVAAANVPIFIDGAVVGQNSVLFLVIPGQKIAPLPLPFEMQYMESHRVPIEQALASSGNETA